MKAVGIKELKNKLSQYLHAVREGELVLVTDRGDVIAQISPPSPHWLGDDASMARSALERMAASGSLRKAIRPAKRLPDIPPLKEKVDLQSILDFVRSDR